VVPFTKHTNVHERVTALLAIDDPSVIQVINVVESHLHQNYTLNYEYIPFKLGHRCAELQDFFNKRNHQKVLPKLFRNLLEQGVKPNILTSSFGFTVDYKLKMHVDTSFELVQTGSSELLEAAVAELLACCERVFEKELSQLPGWGLRNVFSNITEKMKKLNPGQFLKLRRTKSIKESKVSLSEKESSFSKMGGEDKPGNWQFDNDEQFEDESEKDTSNGNDSQRRSMSFKKGANKFSQFLQKKISWVDGESDRTTVLKNKVSEALLRTQKTLTRYERKPLKRRATSFKHNDHST
jgi:hypothetical protein